MKKEIILAVVLIFTKIFVVAQVKSTIGEDSLKYYKSYSEILKDFLSKREYNYTYENLDKEKYFNKVELNPIEMQSVFDTLQSTAKITIEKNTNYSLEFLAKFPKSFSNNELFGICRIDYENSNLSQKTQIFELECGTTNFINKKQVIINGKLIQNKSLTAFRKSYIKDTSIIESLMNGFINYKIKFVTDYQKVKLTKSDINKEFVLCNDTMKLVEIFDNKIVIKCNENNCSNDYLDIQLLNTNSIGQVPNFKGYKLFPNSKSTQSPIKYAFSSSTKITKELYDLIRNNPNFNMLDFIYLVRESMKNNQQSKYLIITSPAPINSEFILSVPIVGYSKIINAKITKY